MLLTEVNKGNLTLKRLVEVSCINPAKRFGLNKGSLEPGMDADIVLVHMEKEKEVKPEMLETKSGWSPFEGHVLTGWPEIVVVNGILRKSL